MSICEKPTTFPSLSDSLSSGYLQPLDRIRVRALLSCVDNENARDARRVIEVLISRLHDYYSAVRYVSPGYVFGKTASEYPIALDKEYVWDRINGLWYQQTLSVSHPTTGPQTIWLKASHLCLMTTLKVAVWEISALAPEATPMLNMCATAAYNACTTKEIGGIRWKESRRRIGTPGIRKVMANALKELSTCAIVIEGYRALVIPAPRIASEREFYMRQGTYRTGRFSFDMPLLAVS